MYKQMYGTRERARARSHVHTYISIGRQKDQMRVRGEIREGRRQNEGRGWTEER